MKNILLSCALAVALAGMPGCTASGNHGFPRELGGIAITQTITGAQARAMVDRMHGKGVTPAENSVARYEGREGETATVFRSTYASPRDAAEAEGRMKELIRKGSDVFTGYGEYLVGRQRVSMCRGFGQIHYFFSSGRDLIWLSGDEGKALVMLQDLLSYSGDRGHE